MSYAISLDGKGWHGEYDDERAASGLTRAYVEHVCGQESGDVGAPDGYLVAERLEYLPTPDAEAVVEGVAAQAEEEFGEQGRAWAEGTLRPAFERDEGGSLELALRYALEDWLSDNGAVPRLTAVQAESAWEEPFAEPQVEGTPRWGGEVAGGEDYPC